MRFSHQPLSVFAALSSLSFTSAQSSNQRCGTSQTTNISLAWHAPSKTPINDLSTVINSTGTHGLLFSPHPASSPENTTYNYCNMPHVSPATYTRPDPGKYKLEYVELIHRHHKRTPYLDNTFPVEAYPWDCSDEGLFYGGQPLNPPSEAAGEAARTYWSVYTSDTNPFPPQGFPGSCQFPQITRGGLEDSHRHGADLRAVYVDLLDFLPSDYDPESVQFRVTNNVITSQVASTLVPGLYPSLANTQVPLKIQQESIDSLEPTYECPYADALFESYGPGSNDSAWLAHLTAAAPLKRRLDDVSGVDPQDEAWSQSYDHYFDALSSRICHSKPLPCNPNATSPSSSDCITHPEANTVLRLGEYEYSFLYRDSALSLAASTASFGVWIAELARNLRSAAAGTGDGDEKVKYRHNVAHDGSVSRLLSILQMEEMVWPGMGGEVGVELYSANSEAEGGEESCYVVRVLWGGRVLRSSHPQLGEMDMLPLETLLAYFDGLVGEGARKVPGLCEQSVGEG